MGAFALFVLNAWYIALGAFIASIAMPIVVLKDKDRFK